jgi:hypothetical protein
MTSHDNLSQIRHRLARSLINLVIRPASDEDVALDVVDLISERMTTHENNQVKVLGAFVRSNIRLFLEGRLAFENIFDRFVDAAAKAPRGEKALMRAFVTGVGPA